MIVTTGSNQPDVEIQCLDLGASDFIAKPYNSRVVIGRINSVIKLKESAQTLIAVEHDELTGLYTRQAFFYHAKTLIRLKPEENFHLIVADVRDFKQINSSYGEKVGDQMLCYLGRAFNKNHKLGLIARYGSDQFVCMTYGNIDLSPANVKGSLAKIAAMRRFPM